MGSSIRSSQSSGEINKPAVSIGSPQSDEVSDIDPIIKKRLVRKLDLRLLIWSFLAYFTAMLDRNNLQNAFTMGMKEDLDLNSSVYNWAVTMFFIGYSVSQVPGNIIITKISPRWFLPSNVIAWGAIASVMSLASDYKVLWALRLCLGIAEAEELGIRIMVFSIGKHFSGALGGLIAGGIADTMHGARGMPAWKWLFIIEGVIAVAVGIAGYFLVPDSPHHTRWLTPEEREVAVWRVENQGRQVTSKAYTWTTVANILLIPYSWLMTINCSCIAIGNQMSYNFAIILRSMGYSASFSNYMITPANLFGAIVALGIGWSSDRTGDRALHIIVAQFWVAVWYLVLGLVNHGNNPAVLLFIGAYAITANLCMLPLALAWTNEIYKADHNTRAVAIAFINSVGNLGPSFINVKTWVVSDAPEFRKITNGAMAFGSVVITSITYILVRNNFMMPKPIEDGHVEPEESRIQEL